MKRLFPTWCASAPEDVIDPLLEEVESLFLEPIADASYMAKYAFIDLDRFLQRRWLRKWRPTVLLVVPQDNLPRESTLLEYAHEAYDQGSLGSCTANAFCTAFRICAKVQQKYPGFEPSRLFYYYNERAEEGTVAEDAGADEADGLHFAAKSGVCSEALWPYQIAKFAETPSPPAFVEAQHYLVQTWGVLPEAAPGGEDIQLLAQIRHLIAVEKQPVMIAVLIYESFNSMETALTGAVKYPDIATEQCLGGHEMCIIGYNDELQAFLVQNSWGPRWGRNGRCYLRYKYVLDPCLTIELSTFSL